MNFKMEKVQKTPIDVHDILLTSGTFFFGLKRPLQFTPVAQIKPYHDSNR